MDTAAKIHDLKADAKAVYTVGVNVLVELADKYGVTTRSLTYAKENPSPICANIGVQAFGSKNTEKEIRSKLYAEIKTQLRELEG